MQAEGRVGRGRRLVLALLLAVAASGAALDLVTKHFAADRLSTGHGQLIVCPWLNLIYSENEGGVFGFGHGRTGLFVVLSIAAIAAICWMVLRSDVGWLGAAALGLVLGGAIGNLYDRMALGHVRDFIDFHIGSWHWYTFNVADALICVGVVPLMLEVMFHAKEGPDKGAGRTPGATR